MAITLLTRTQIVETLQAFVSTRLPTIVVTSDSDIGARIEMIAEAVLGLQSNIKSVENDLFPSGDTSTEALEKHAEARFGPSARKGATTATGTDAVRAYGTVGTVLSAGLTLRFTDGTRYQTTTSGTLSGSSASVDLSVASIDTGAAANRDSGEKLTFESPPSGVQGEADIIAAIDGAQDAESDGALLARILDAYRNPPASGRFSDYRQWANAVAGVASAYVYGPSSNDTDGRRGIGAVDVAILKDGSGANRIPDATLQQAVSDAIDDARPAVARDYAVLLPTAAVQPIDVQITPKTGYGWDWDDGGSPKTVSAYDAPTRRITASGSVTSYMAVGDRLVVSGQLRTVESFPLSNEIVVTEAFDVAPTGGETIYAGGPLSAPVAAAIQGLFDALGPARSDAADPDQDWESALLLAGLYDVVMDVEGVRNAVLVTPAADVAATDTGAAVELLVYDESSITVRPA